MSIRRVDKIDVCNRIRQRRRAAGLTQQQLADRVGVSRRAVQFIEYGTYSPTVGVALRLAKVLDVSVGQLFTLKDPDWQPFAAQWAEQWPRRITLRQAAAEIGFDLFAGDDPNAKLVKGWVVVDEVATYSIAELADNDAEDRFAPLEAGLAAGGADVPPVVVVPGETGLRDGYHRAALAEQAGLTRIPAYLPAYTPPVGGQQ